MKRNKESTDDSITADKLLSMSVDELYGLIELVDKNSYICVVTWEDDPHQQVEGILWIGDSFVLEYSGQGVWVLDVRGKRLLRVTNNNIEKIEHNKILDLNDNGERWEGDVLDGKTYGWGVLYDADNQMLYEGFKLDSYFEGYGKMYYSDIHLVEYEGGMWNNERWGKGTLYDRNGKVVYDGEWLDTDHWYTKLVVDDYCDFLGRLHNGVEELIVKDDIQIEEEMVHLDFHYVQKLRVLKIQTDCFCNVSVVKLIGMKALESVEIEDDSFVVEEQTEDESGLYVKDCPRLKEFKIGASVFYGYTVCQFENLPSLEVLELGDPTVFCTNFYTSSLELKGISSDQT